MNYKLNDNNVNESMLELYKALGRETVEKIYHIMGGEKFTVKPLINHIKREQVSEALKTNKSIKKICIEIDVTKPTVYKMLKLNKKIIPPEGKTEN